MAGIYSYLQKIEASEPIRFEVFQGLLLKEGYLLREIRATFNAVKIKPNLYRVEVLDRSILVCLIRRYAPSGVPGRVGAALDGDSHRSGVSATLPLIRNLNNPFPVVVVCSDNSWVAPRPVLRRVVIVENHENFIRFQETFSLLANLLPGEIDSIELMLGSGNQVTNGLNLELLRSFDQVYCLFDVDLGGLRMFSTLWQMLPDKRPCFLYPDDIQQRLAASRFPMDMSQRQSISVYAGLSQATDTLITLMRDAGCMLEQETYLAHKP